MIPNPFFSQMCVHNLIFLNSVCKEDVHCDYGECNKSDYTCECNDYHYKFLNPEDPRECVGMLFLLDW